MNDVPFPEWPVCKPIIRITFGERSSSIEVGRDGVTKIEPTFKSGLHSNIPYVRVWKGEYPYAEFCQHAIEGVIFDGVPEQADDLPF